MAKPITFAKRSMTTASGRRAGLVKLELLVACLLLVTTLSLALSLCHRINSVWRDVSHHRRALDELSNQMDELTRMSPEQVSAALDQLQPSPECQAGLPEPRLSGRLVPDSLGQRIELQMQWNARVASPTIRLAGWIVPASPSDPQGDGP